MQLATHAPCQLSPSRSQLSCQGEQEELAYAHHRELKDLHVARWGLDDKDNGEESVPDEPLVATNPTIKRAVEKLGILWQDPKHPTPSMLAGAYFPEKVTTPTPP